MAEFVDKYNMKYPDYEFPDNHCVSSSTFSNLKVDPKNMHQIENIDFWNKAYNYNNQIIGDNGQIMGLKGVCNPNLINHCEKIQNPNPGVCSTSSFFSPPNNLPYKKSNLQYKLANPDTFTISDNFKLDSHSEIINDESFAKLYCKSGSMKQQGEKYYCF